jgi:hypothetical protein
MTQEPPAPPEPASDRYGIILAVLGGVLVALIAVVVVILITRSDDGSADTTTAAATTVPETTSSEATTTLGPTTAETTTTAVITTTTAPAPTTTAAPFSGDTNAKSGPAQGTPTGRVIDIRHGDHDDYTRVVFDFSPGGIPGYFISYSDPTTLSVLFISMDTANPYEPDVFDPAGEHAIGTGSVVSVFSGGEGAGSGEWQFPIQLTGQRPFSVGTLPDPPRLYIDIGD